MRRVDRAVGLVIPAKAGIQKWVPVHTAPGGGGMAAEADSLLLGERAGVRALRRYRRVDLVISSGAEKSLGLPPSLPNTGLRLPVPYVTILLHLAPNPVFSLPPPPVSAYAVS